MSLTRTIAHNTIYQMISKILSAVLGILTVGLMTRYLGQTGFGQYTTILAFLQFFGILVDMGLYIILIKKISEPGADEQAVVSNIFTLRLFSAIIFLGLAPIAVLFFPYPAVVKTGVAITAFSILFITLNQVLIGVFQKNLSLGRVAFSEVISKVALVLFTLLAIVYNRGLLPIMVAVVLGSFVNFLLTFLFSRRWVKITLGFDFTLWRRVIHESWPIAISIALNLIYFKADTIILSLYYPAATVGIYGAPYKILEVLIAFPAMFAGLVLTLLTRTYQAHDLERFRAVLQKSFDFMIMVAVPLVVGTYFIAYSLMVFIASNQFYLSGGILRILIVATASIFVGNLFGNTVVAIGQQKKMIFLYLGVAVVALTGYLLLIPRYSYYGAAWMTVVSEVSICLGAIYLVLKTTKVRLHLVMFGKSIVASAVMGLVLFLAHRLPVLVLIGMAPVIYLVTLYCLKGFSRALLGEIMGLRPRV